MTIARLTVADPPARERDAEGDYRGAYGMGRSAHGADPTASYGFERGETLLPLSTDKLAARVSLRDLHYEVDEAGGRKACMTVCVDMGKGHFNFCLAFSLTGQEGRVEATLDQAQERLKQIFRAALRDLETQPIGVD